MTALSDAPRSPRCADPTPRRGPSRGSLWEGIDLLDGFNCFLPEVRAYLSHGMQPPSAAFSAYTGGARRVTPPEAGRARVCAPLSVAFSRSIFERRASMGSRQRLRDRRACGRATARPRVFSPISHPSVPTRSLYPPCRMPISLLRTTRASVGSRPACSPAAHVGNARIDRRRAFPRASLAASRRPPQFGAHRRQLPRLAARLSRSFAADL